MIDLVAAVLALTALFAYINVRWIKLPSAIGLLLTALLSALGVKAAAAVGLVDLSPVIRVLQEIDFRETLLEGMLGPLLFAGALHVDWTVLRDRRWPVFLLATVGTVVATCVIALGLWAIAPIFGFAIPPLWALAFGVLIAPTDPIAVGALLKKAGVPPQLQTTITGESLFNDGIAVVLFLAVLGVLASGSAPDPAGIASLLALEVGGGVAFGIVLGWLAVVALRAVDDYQVEILVTLALVSAGFALSRRLHVSGVLGMVVLGLIIGRTGRAMALSPITQQRLDEFWELIDEFLNAALFVLIGVEILVLDFRSSALWLGVAMIPMTLLARFISIVLPLAPLRERFGWPSGTIRLLTWAGVRGGISIALALALPVGPMRTTLLAVTYVVVCFSVLVQGLTMERVVKRLLAPS
ncbi:MAG: sodium:proton antiporter [Gemmatimonadaceae bacterium]|nr:sodium:proton antiporter [Gemmatimonadaceae bacterium]